MSGWNTIESDAGVFTELIEKLGVKGAEFDELLSIDDESLRQLGTIYGVIFLFKYRASEFAKQKASHSDRPLDGEYVEDGNVFFAHQMIQNACATQAVLSVLLNNPTIDIGSDLQEFKGFVDSFDPELRGETISNSDLIRTVHNSFSRPTPFIDESEDQRHDEEDDGLYHFIAYVPVDGRLYELDGLHPYPISHGPCANEEFANKLPEVLQRRISRAPEGELRFNLLALTRDKRQYYSEIGDAAGLAREEHRRAEWSRENALRRENFVGIIYDLIKGIGSKLSDEDWAKTIERGRAQSKKYIEQRRSH
jgi:ubiquitin carboxyl-terminal hydrolase L5